MSTVNAGPEVQALLPDLTNQPDPLKQIQQGLLQLQNASKAPDSIVKKLAPVITASVFLLGGVAAWYDQTQQNDKAIAVLEQRIGESDHLGTLGSRMKEFMRYQHLHNERIDASLDALSRRLDFVLNESDSQEEREYRRLKRKFDRENN